MKASRVHLFLLAMLALLILPPTLQAQDENRAALVVNFGDRVSTQCVSFSEPQITGYDLLVRAGLSVEIEAGGIGAAVCRLNDTGCPADDCFCQCKGGDECIYWSYWHRTDGTWQYSPVGASGYQVQDGAVEGWSWGPGSPDQAIPPPDLSFADVCAPAATATSPPTATLPPTATSPPPTATSPPPSVNFAADASNVVAGSCTTLRWDVQNVQAVYLDGGGVMGQGELRVCPASTQTFTLRAVHGDGETVRQVTVEVTATTPTQAAPTVAATAPPSTATSAPSVPTATLQPANGAEVTATPPATATGSLASSATPSPAGADVESVTAATPTVTAIVVTVPPLPTEAPAAAVVAVQPTRAAPTAFAGEVEAPASGSVPWLNYAGFAVLAVALGLALVVVQRREEAG